MLCTLWPTINCKLPTITHRLQPSGSSSVQLAATCSCGRATDCCNGAVTVRTGMLSWTNVTCVCAELLKTSVAVVVSVFDPLAKPDSESRPVQPGGPESPRLNTRLACRPSTSATTL